LRRTERPFGTIDRFISPLPIFSFGGVEEQFKSFNLRGKSALDHVRLSVPMMCGATWAMKTVWRHLPFFLMSLSFIVLLLASISPALSNGCQYDFKVYVYQLPPTLPSVVIDCSVLPDLIC
jgi:hypothetical protein